MRNHQFRSHVLLRKARNINVKQVSVFTGLQARFAMLVEIHATATNGAIDWNYFEIASKRYQVEANPLYTMAAIGGDASIDDLDASSAALGNRGVVGHDDK